MTEADRLEFKLGLVVIGLSSVREVCLLQVKAVMRCLLSRPDIGWDIFGLFSGRKPTLFLGLLFGDLIIVRIIFLCSIVFRFAGRPDHHLVVVIVEHLDLLAGRLQCLQLVLNFVHGESSTGLVAAVVLDHATRVVILHDDEHVHAADLAQLYCLLEHIPSPLALQVLASELVLAFRKLGLGVGVFHLFVVCCLFLLL